MKNQNPRTLPARLAPRLATKYCPFQIAAAVKKVKAIVAVPAASPSMLSKKLMELKMKRNQKMVRSTENPGIPTKREILVLLKSAVAAAMTSWPRNFVPALRGRLSSMRPRTREAKAHSPMTAKSPATQWIPRMSEARLRSTASGRKNFTARKPDRAVRIQALNMAAPPRRGVAFSWSLCFSHRGISRKEVFLAMILNSGVSSREKPRATMNTAA